MSKQAREPHQPCSPSWNGECGTGVPRMQHQKSQQHHAPSLLPVAASCEVVHLLDLQGSSCICECWRTAFDRLPLKRWRLQASQKCPHNHMKQFVCGWKEVCQKFADMWHPKHFFLYNCQDAHSKSLTTAGCASSQSHGSAGGDRFAAQSISNMLLLCQLAEVSCKEVVKVCCTAIHGFLDTHRQRLQRDTTVPNI